MKTPSELQGRWGRETGFSIRNVPNTTKGREGKSVQVLTRIKEDPAGCWALDDRLAQAGPPEWITYRAGESNGNTTRSFWPQKKSPGGEKKERPATKTWLASSFGQ